MFKWFVTFFLSFLAVSAYTQPIYLQLNGAKQQAINDREFLRSYNMGNVNTLAALTRYGMLQRGIRDQ